MARVGPKDLLDQPTTRQQNAKSRSTAIKINPGGHYVTRDKNDMIVTVLGSCVAACIRDPLAGVGGMNHFMLPESDDGAWGAASASLRYGNFAMERLINDILCRGGHRSRLEVKVFGGARLFGNGAQVGPQNADFVEAYLKEEGLRIAAAHLRGEHARRIHYFPHTGVVKMLELPRTEASLATIEIGYGASLRSQPSAGSMELFD
jgi:chemotaxis protein CheD